VKNAYLRYCEEEIETMRGREITEWVRAWEKSERRWVRAWENRVRAWEKKEYVGERRVRAWEKEWELREKKIKLNVKLMYLGTVVCGVCWCMY
jgi:hypothetical protein